MKNLVLALACAVSLAGFAAEQKILDIRPDAAKKADAPSAVDWQKENDAKIAEATQPDMLKAFVADAEAADKLLAEVKTGYAGCPMKLTQIAAVSQYVMVDDGCPLACLWFWRQSKADMRKVWADALLRNAEKATAPDVAEFMLDQLRWCGCVCQASAVRALGEKVKCPCVKQMAELVAAELEQSVK